MIIFCTLYSEPKVLCVLIKFGLLETNVSFVVLRYKMYVNNLEQHASLRACVLQVFHLEEL